MESQVVDGVLRIRVPWQWSQLIALVIAALLTLSTMGLLAYTAGVVHARPPQVTFECNDGKCQRTRGRNGEWLNVSREQLLRAKWDHFKSRPALKEGEDFWAILTSTENREVAERAWAAFVTKVVAGDQHARLTLPTAFDFSLVWLPMVPPIGALLLTIVVLATLTRRTEAELDRAGDSLRLRTWTLFRKVELELRLSSLSAVRRRNLGVPRVTLWKKRAIELVRRDGPNLELVGGSLPNAELVRARALAEEVALYLGVPLIDD